MSKNLKQTEKQIEEYIRDLEQLDDDPAPNSELRKEELENKLEYEKSKKEQLQELKESLDKSPNDHLSLTDEDSKSIHKRGKSCVGYNV